jgi:trk system potassium uptake protein TrkA
VKVIVCGAGQVGYGIAERLAAEQAEVSVIDVRPQLVQSISDTLEVRGFVGHASHPDVLTQAGVADADMIVAVTQSDEVNMMACQVAGSLFGVPTKVARVRAQSYLAPHWRDLFSREHLPIDVVISPELEVADTVRRRLETPGTVDTVDFVDGRVVVAATTCEADCPVVDTPLEQLTDLFPDLDATIVGVVRAGKVFVPRRTDQLVPGDVVYFAAAKDRVPRTLSIFGHEEAAATRVVVAGGGNIGYEVARRLEAAGSKAKVRIVESQRERALSIADKLKKAVVLHGTALDQDVLREADVEHADALVAVTNDDQVNILSCVLGKRLGAKRALCLTNNRSYPQITRELGIDTYINPRTVTVSRILQHIRRGRIRGVYAVQDGAAEIIEAEALETSPLVGKPLRELGIFDGVRIGAIVRDKRVVPPRGDTMIRAKDRIVIFALADRVRRVEQMFRVSIEFF